MSHAEQVFGTCLFVFTVSVAVFLTECTTRTVRYSSEEVAFNPPDVVEHPSLLPPCSPGHFNKSK